MRPKDGPFLPVGWWYRIRKQSEVLRAIRHLGVHLLRVLSNFYGQVRSRESGKPIFPISALPGGEILLDPHSGIGRASPRSPYCDCEACGATEIKTLIGQHRSIRLTLLSIRLAPGT